MFSTIREKSVFSFQRYLPSTGEFYAMLMQTEIANRYDPFPPPDITDRLLFILSNWISSRDTYPVKYHGDRERVNLIPSFPPDPR